MNQIDLYFFTGFLGSGKSSVIRNIISREKNRRIAVVLNDFGDLGVDSTLMPQDTALDIQELTGGQVFCSCLSGKFIDTVASFADRNIDLLLVEASGLSKPANVLEVLRWIQEVSDNRFSYRGMICVIDASRYLTLSQVLPVLEEQIRFSDCFIINKTDLADETALSHIEENIASLQPEGSICRSSFGSIPSDILDMQTNLERLEKVDQSPYQGWGSLGRPKTFTLKPLNPVSKSGLSRFIDEASRSCYRIKGYVITDDRELFYVSAVGENRELIPAPALLQPPKTGLVCIQRSNGTGDTVFPSRWKLLTGGSIRVIPGGSNG